MNFLLAGGTGYVVSLTSASLFKQNIYSGMFKVNLKIGTATSDRK